MSACANCGLQGRPSYNWCTECGFSVNEVAERDPWFGRLIAGRFRLQSRLGAGGMGEVYEAIQEPMDRRVAVKLLNDQMAMSAEQVARFKREAQAASQLEHPSTITVHDFGQDSDGTLFIAMEYLKGQSLDAWIKHNGRPDLARAVDIFIQVCDSLEEAHTKGVVHRDLKPENIFLATRAGTTDVVKVLDFGIAKISQTPVGGSIDQLTAQGAICGTPHYMAPEQITDGVVDQRTDIYALGVMLYWLIAGREPCQATTFNELLTMHLKQLPPPIPNEQEPADPRWRDAESVAARALSKAPQDRFQSVASLREALTTLIASDAPALLSATTSRPESTRSSAWAFGVLALGVVVAVVLFFSLYSQSDPTPRPKAPPPTATQEVVESKPSIIFGLEKFDMDEILETSADPGPTGTGTILLTELPERASVSLNGVKMIWSPDNPSYRLKTGRYEVEVELDGVVSKVQVNVRDGKRRTIDWRRVK